MVTGNSRGRTMGLDANPVNRATGHLCVPLCLFLSRCTHSLDILLFNVFQQRKLVIMTKKRCFMEVLLDHVCVLALKRRSRYE